MHACNFLTFPRVHKTDEAGSMDISYIRMLVALLCLTSKVDNIANKITMRFHTHFLYIAKV